jgi:hypothetical protein
MKPVKLFDDYLNMAAAAQNMSREQYTATYLSEDKTNDIINEWGSSDQNIMNQQIHKDAGSPKKMPSPFDRKLRAAAEDAVDWHWDDWPEYKRDRDGLIDNAVRSYLRSYFPKDWATMVRMFEPMESIQVTEQDRNTLGELNDMTLGQLERIEDYAEMISDRMEAGQQLDS